jgi:lipopolysaccharide exporter
VIGEKPNNWKAIDVDNLGPPEPLSKRVVRGGIWVFALRIISRGLGLIRTIILARLLAPEDFGLVGIAMLAIATLETFSQTGFM